MQIIKLHIWFFIAFLEQIQTFIETVFVYSLVLVIYLF